jgi:UrcA family protein
MFKTIITAATIATALVPAAATAAPRDEASVRVDVSDLDLSQPADRARADRRINAAVRSLCYTSGARSVSTRNAEAACRDQALASVRPLGF